MKNIHLSCALVYWLDAYDTGPKLRFTTCSMYQNMTFPHISNIYLAEDRVEFYVNKWNV